MNSFDHVRDGAGPAFLTKKEVARLLGFSPRHVCTLMRAGLPHLRFGNRRTRFDAGEVVAWCKKEFGVRRRGPLNPKPATPTAAATQDGA